MATESVAPFLFWKTGQPVEPFKASVHGQFGGLDIELNSIHMIGNPAEKSGEKPEHPDLHLTGYELSSFPPFQAKVLVSNEFGEETCDLGSPVFLLVPAFKTHNPQLLPDKTPRGPHFLCYRVLEGRSIHPRVTLNDQFGQLLEKPYLTLRYLGVPVNKNSEGMWQKGAVHLALYDIDASVELQPSKTVYIRDQFQKEMQLTATHNVFLGLPSKKTVLQK